MKLLSCRRWEVRTRLRQRLLCKKSVSFSYQKHINKFSGIQNLARFLQDFESWQIFFFIELGFVTCSINNNLLQRCFLKHLYPDLFFGLDWYLARFLQESCKFWINLQDSCKIWIHSSLGRWMQQKKILPLKSANLTKRNIQSQVVLISH